MNLKELLSKYTEENAMIDLKPSNINAAGNLPVTIVFGKTSIPIQVAKENVTPLDKTGETFQMILSETAINQIQQAILKEKGNNQQYSRMAESLKSFVGKKIKVYLNKVEIVYNTETGILNFR